MLRLVFFGYDDYSRMYGVQGLARRERELSLRTWVSFNVLPLGFRHEAADSKYVKTLAASGGIVRFPS